MKKEEFKQLFEGVVLEYGDGHKPVRIGDVLEKINKETGYVVAMHYANDLLCTWGVCGFDLSVQDIVIKAISNEEKRDPYFRKLYLKNAQNLVLHIHKLQP